MVSDPIGDMLIQIKNAYLAKKGTVVLPYSKMKHAVAKILVKEGYLSTAEQSGQAPKLLLSLGLKYHNGKDSAIVDVKRKSKPGLRWYINKTEIPKVVGGIGIAIISTSSGIMTGIEARKRGLGGELLCEVW